MNTSSSIEDGKRTIEQNSDSDDEPLSKIARKPNTEKGSSQDNEYFASDTNCDNKPRPLTAFAHYFNENRTSIEHENAAATREQISSIITTMWDSLDANTKLIYQKMEEEGKSRLDESLCNVIPKLINEETATEGTKESISLTDEGSTSLGSHENPVADNSDGKRLSEVLPIANSQPVADTISQPVTVLANETGTTDSQPTTTSTTPTTRPVVAAQTSLPNLPTVVRVDSSGKTVMVNTQGSQGLPIISSAVQSVKGVSLISSTHQPNQPVVTAKYIITTKGTVVQQAGTNEGQEKPYQIITLQPVTASSNAVTMNENTPAHGPQQSDSRITISTSSHMTPVATDDVDGKQTQAKVCMHSTCSNSPVKNKKWGEDFCSSQCLVDYCKESFQAWVTARQ